jgi:ribosome-binding factor A
MPKNSSRSGRLGDLMHRELARLIRDELTDPRIGMVTISSVAVTDDLSYARVYITVLQDDKQEISVEALNHAAGFFRMQVSKKVTTRIVPRIKFFYDHSLNTGTRIEQLLKSANISPAPTETNEDETTD